jgi:[acyl-carrier-protein] S-malonyltransferase
VIALVFPGQGVDPPWVAPEVLARPELQERIALASEATGVDVQQLLRRGGRELARTEVLQPALVAVCLGVTRLLGITPMVVAGHSLGELTAWAASGAIGDADAIAVAALRGKLMAAAAAREPGGMIALHDVFASPGCPGEAAPPNGGAESIAGLCVAARNAPDEVVLSGPLAAVARVEREHASKRLAVAGAWHSSAMADAVPELSRALHAIPRRAGIAFVANRDGARVADPDAIPDLLAQQLVRPIEWVAAQRTLARMTRRWIVVGPGAVVRALARRTVPEVEIELVDSLRDVDRIGAAA